MLSWKTTAELRQDRLHTWLLRQVHDDKCCSLSFIPHVPYWAGTRWQECVLSHSSLKDGLCVTMALQAMKLDTCITISRDLFHITNDVSFGEQIDPTETPIKGGVASPKQDHSVSQTRGYQQWLILFWNRVLLAAALQGLPDTLAQQTQAPCSGQRHLRTPRFSPHLSKPHCGRRLGLWPQPRWALTEPRLPPQNVLTRWLTGGLHY